MSRAIQIQVNGEARGWSQDRTIADLLRELDLKPDRVAVELNLEILDRNDFATRSLHDGDRVEILSFIGGGSGCREVAGVPSVLAHPALEKALDGRAQEEGTPATSRLY